MTVPHRILVVDDNPVICELIQEVLSSVEMEAFTLTDSSKAALHLAREKFDAVFLDVRMPSASRCTVPSVIKVSWLSAQNGDKWIRTNQDKDSVKG
jgi:CheY-like chemotaxis protein